MIRHLIEQTYRVAERVAIFTFLENQLPDGGFPPLHYPTRDDSPELRFHYRPLKGTVRVPHEQGSRFGDDLPAREEIAGEFLGELKPIEAGVAAWLASEDQGQRMMPCAQRQPPQVGKVLP